MADGLTCFVEGLIAPSMNSLLTMYCIGNKPKVETKADVRLFRLKLMQKLPRWDCPKEGWLSLSLRFVQPWHYQNGQPKKQDVPNLLKCVLDTISERYRFDDSRIWHLNCEKAEGKPIGIAIQLSSLTVVAPAIVEEGGLGETR